MNIHVFRQQRGKRWWKENGTSGTAKTVSV